MLILENDLRWQRIWWLLSLDDSAAFFEELWVPIGADRMAQGLRSILQQWREKPDLYLSNPSYISYECFRWFEETLGADELQIMIGWAQNVYIGPGLDRIAEWGWSQLAARVRKDEMKKKEIDGWIVNFLERLKVNEIQVWDHVSRRLELQFQTAISDWDRAALGLQNTSREAVKDQIALIISRNIFAYTWEQLANAMGAHELEHLYQVGKNLASEYRLDNEGVAFPGAWRFSLLPLIRRTPVRWKSPS